MDEKKYEDLIYKVLMQFYQKILLPKMATKEDLERFATKEDVAKMATKEELFAVESRLEKRIDKIAEVVTDVKTNHELRIRKLEVEVGIVAKPLAV